MQIGPLEQFLRFIKEGHYNRFESLLDGDPELALDTAQIAGEIAADEEDPTLRSKAILFLSVAGNYLPRDNRMQIASLVETLLHDDEPAVRSAAVETYRNFWLIALDQEKAAGNIASMLTDRQDDVRLEAVRVFSQLYPYIVNDRNDWDNKYREQFHAAAAAREMPDWAVRIIESDINDRLAWVKRSWDAERPQAVECLNRHRSPS